jgi:hypothetical protein
MRTRHHCPWSTPYRHVRPKGRHRSTGWQVAATATVAIALAGAQGAAAVASSAVSSRGYQFSQLVVPRGSVECSNAFVNQMNSKGVLVGTVYCGDAHGFIRGVNGQVRHFNVAGPKGTDTEPFGISTNGTIALITQVNYKGRYTSYLRAPSGTLTKVRDPKAGHIGTLVEAVNDSKEAVGIYYTGRTRKHYQPFIDRDGTFSTFRLGLRAAKRVQLIDVNDRGELAGDFIDGKGVEHGFLSEHGKTRVINSPGAGKKKGEGTVVEFVTNTGNYCGAVTFKTGTPWRNTYRGFVHIGSHYRAVRVPSSMGHDTSVTSMTDSGEIAGGYIESTGTSRAGRWQRDAFTAGLS